MYEPGWNQLIASLDPALLTALCIIGCVIIAVSVRHSFLNLYKTNEKFNPFSGTSGILLYGRMNKQIYSSYIWIASWMIGLLPGVMLMYNGAVIWSTNESGKLISQSMLQMCFAIYVITFIVRCIARYMTIDGFCKKYNMGERWKITFSISPFVAETIATIKLLKNNRITEVA